MSAGDDPSAEPPTSGTNRFPDPFAPAPAPRSDSPDSSSSGTPSVAPGDQDLPWKATAERRDLWGPIEKPLQGTVHTPASRAVGPARRSPLVRFGAPVVLGGLAALAALAVMLGTGLGGPVLALAAAAGVGVVTLGGVGAAANRPLPAATARPVLDASVPDKIGRAHV